MGYNALSDINSPVLDAELSQCHVPGGLKLPGVVLFYLSREHLQNLQTQLTSSGPISSHLISSSRLRFVHLPGSIRRRSREVGAI